MLEHRASASTAGYDPTYTWDAAPATWKRSIAGRAPFVDVGGDADRADERGRAVHATTRRSRGRAQSARATRGCSPTASCAAGRWIRPIAAQPARYVDAYGTPILLRPGRTWVELLPAGYPVDLGPAAPAAHDVPPTTATGHHGEEAKK